jgi:hypothetical protein
MRSNSGDNESRFSRRMTTGGRRALVLAADYRVDDVDGIWSELERRHSVLARIGAHHLALYASSTDPGG